MREQFNPALKAVSEAVLTVASRLSAEEVPPQLADRARERSPRRAREYVFTFSFEDVRRCTPRS